MGNRKLTPVDLEALAARRLQGWDVADLAKFYDYSPSGMRSLLDSEEVQTALSRRRDAIDTVGARMVARLAVHGPAVADRILQRALSTDDEDKHCWDAQKFIAERLMPARETHVSETNITFNAQTNNVLTNIGTTLDSIREVVAKSRGQFDCTDYLTTDSGGPAEAAGDPHPRTQPAPGATGDDPGH